MKTKTVTLTIPIPKGYKWIAQQPWGEWVCFRKNLIVI